jgi:rhodanese-related sulfurtransferase
MAWQEVSVQEFTPTSDTLIVDVREIDEYQDGHIPGAVNVPLSVLESEVTRIPSTGTIYVVCRSGARSARACDFLTQQSSHQSAAFINVGGGTAGWIAEGREVVSGDNPK